MEYRNIYNFFPNRLWYFFEISFYKLENRCSFEYLAILHLKNFLMNISFINYQQNCYKSKNY